MFAAERGRSCKISFPQASFHLEEKDVDTMADPENLNSPGDERRASDRSRLIVDVFFNGQDGTGVASTKDISVGGLYMNTQTALPEGALLTLRLPLGVNEEDQIVVNAEVVYINSGRGVGVRFHGLPEKDRVKIEHLLLAEG